MCKTFYNIDLFGKAVLFNYKGSSKSKSKAGAVCTVVLLGFIVWLLIDFGQALFDKSNPKATSYESYNENPSATPITVDNFVFAIGMADPVTYLNYRNDSIFTVYASTYKATRVPQANGTVEMAYVQIPLEMEPCRADHFGELADEFSYLALDQIYCLNKDQPNLEGGYPILEGQFESPTFQSVYIKFQVCDNDTSAVTCGTQEEINKWLQGAYMSLVYSNMAVDLTNSKTPLQKFRDGYYTTVDNSYYKEVTLSLEQLEINTDDGWLTTNYMKGDYIKFGDIKEFLSLNPKSSFAYFSMRLSNVKQHYNRSYTKIQDIIAQVNGTVTVVFTVLFIVIAPYVRLKFYEALINDIFDIKTSKRKQKGKKNKRKNTKTEDNSKTVDPTNNLKPADNKVEIQIKDEDLEQQRPNLKTQNDPMLTNRTELTERNYTEDANLMKRWPTFEEASCLPQYNPVNLKQNSNNFNFSTSQNEKLVDIKAAEVKKKIQFQHSRGLSGVPLTSSVSQISQIEIKPETHYDLMISPLASPIESKNGGLLPSRKPTFKQPHFKILDYEEHGQDLFEDILKTIDQAEKKCTKDPPTDDFVISDIRSEEKENLDPQDENLRTDRNRGLPSEEIQSNHEEEHKQERKQEKPSHAKYKLQRLDLITSKNVEEINLSFSEYLRSYFSKSDAIREKMCILDEGIKRINERLDIFNIFKKLRELDKLKVLLLENEQFVLFEGLPRPQLTLKKKDATPNSPAVLSKTKIKDPRFIHEKTKQDLILLSYENLKHKSVSSMLDKKLFDIYDDILCLKP